MVIIALNAFISCVLIILNKRFILRCGWNIINFTSCFLKWCLMIVLSPLCYIWMLFIGIPSKKMNFEPCYNLCRYIYFSILLWNLAWVYASLLLGIHRWWRIINMNGYLWIWMDRTIKIGFANICQVFFELDVSHAIKDVCKYAI